MSEETPLQKAVRLAKEQEPKNTPTNSISGYSNPYKDMSYEDYVASKKKAPSQVGSANGGSTTSSPASSKSSGLSWAKPTDKTVNISQQEFVPEPEPIAPEFKPTLGKTINTNTPNLQNNGGFMQDIGGNLSNERFSPKAVDLSQRLTKINQAYDKVNPESNTASSQAASKDSQLLTESPEMSERNGGRSKYLYNSFLNGIGSLAASVGDIGATVMAGSPSVGYSYNANGQPEPRTPEQMQQQRDALKDYRKNTAPQIREYLKGTIGADVDKGLEAKFDNETITGAIGGLFSSVPAMLMPAPLRGAAMILQGYDSGMQSINASDVNGEVDDLTKTIYATGVGTVNGLLEKVGFDKIMGAGTSKMAKQITDKALEQAVKETGGKVTGDVLTKFLNANVRDLATKYSKFGVKAFDGFVTEFATGSMQETANIGSEILLNRATGKPIFDVEDSTTMDGFLANLKRIGYSGLQEGIGGGALGGFFGGHLSKKSIDAKTASLDKLNDELENPDLSDTSKEVLVQNKISLTNEIEVLQAEQADIVSKLTPEQTAKIEEADAQINKLSAVLDDPNVSDEVKGTIQSQINLLEADLSQLISGNSNEADVATIKVIASETVEQSAQMMEELAERLADVTTPQEVAEIRAEAIKVGADGINAAQILNTATVIENGNSVTQVNEPSDAVSIQEENRSKIQEMTNESVEVEARNAINTGTDLTPTLQDNVSDIRTLDATEIAGTRLPPTVSEIQGSSQDRKKTLVKERIPHEITAAPTKSNKKINQIIKDVSDGLNATLIYSAGGRKNSAGSYDPSNTLIKIKNAGDIDTAAHEIGHLIDDRYDLLGNKPSGTQIKGRIKDSIEKEIKWYFDRGGSNPPQGLDTASKKHYLQREGFGEFIRAYIANPREALNRSPELYKYFEQTIDDKTKVELQKFSKDYIDFANSTAGEQVMANIESLETKSPGIKEWLTSFSRSEDDFSVTPLDKLKSHVFDSMTIANKAFEYILDTKGISTILPEKNFDLMARVFAGVNGKINRALETGLLNGKNEYVLSSAGERMNIKWLFDKLDATSEATLVADMDNVIQLLVAERTSEYAEKFNRSNDLTGIGGGIKDDLSVANNYLTTFNGLKNSDPEFYNRIRESVERYREYADTGLQYAVEKGRISVEDYNKIKENNQYYVSLARVKEVAPTVEPLGFINQFAKGGIATVKDVLKVSKGGTRTIQNPYLSLIKNTTDLIREADRNEVLRTFVQPLNANRGMGNGTPINYSRIARKVAPGETNAKSIYVDGKKQFWQFQDDIYKSLTEMDGLKTNFLTKVAAAPASLLRSSVTMFPTFFMKNAVRDTQSRIVLSRTGSGLKELVHTLEDKELFELYGGSQAGFHLIDKNAYANTLSTTIRELAQSGKGIVLDPRKIGDLWSGYKKFLEAGENMNRIAEFQSAYKKAKADGLNDYNAGLQAAYEARDLMDFAVAGHTMRLINRYIPFTNAAIQGLRRSAKAINEDPVGFTTRVALYTILPQLATRAIVHAMGDDDEYEQLPAYQRDLCYTFRTPFTGDLWICIPKPFDIGMVSSLFDRSISKAAGNDHAFSGFKSSALNVLLPFDEGSVYGGFKPYIEAGFINKDTFRDTDIIPFYELHKPIDQREGATRASSLGKMISETFGAIPYLGKDVDPRLLDHVIKGQLSYFGDWALSTSNVITGNTESRFQFNANKTGFANENPVAGAQVVKDVYELSKQLGVNNSAAMSSMKRSIKAYYSTSDQKTKNQIAETISAQALGLRLRYEKELEKRKSSIK